MTTGTSPEETTGPADLRLVPPACAAWGAAAVTLGVPGRWTAAVAAGALAVALAVWVRLRGRGGDGRSGVAGVAVATALCACAAACSAGLAATALHRGPIPRLAARGAEATVDVTLTGDPHRTSARPPDAMPAPPVVVARAEAVRVAADGVTTTVRTPVLLIAEPGGSGRSGGSGERSPPGGADAWLRLLPSTTLRLTARLDRSDRPGDDIAALAVVHGAPRVIAGPSRLHRVAGSLRAGLRAATAQLAPDVRALLPGLVVGDTSGVPPDLRAAFDATDLSHLLAVSGANLTLVLALFIGPPALATRAERRGLAARSGLSLRRTAVLGAVLTAGFVVLCRPEPSVLRAAVCGLITLAAIGTGRRRSLLPALAATVLVLVLADPWLARSFGFALSVLATGALLTLAPRWAEGLRRHGVPPRAAEALGAAAAAQACCAPVIAVLAAHVSLVAVPCNLLAEVAVAPATVAGFAALAVAPVSLPAAKALAWLAGWPVRWVAWVARTGADLPGARLGWPGGWRGGLLLAVVTVAAVGLVRRIRPRPWMYAALVVALLVAVVRPAPLTRFATGWPPPGWRMVVCDVGQGDALVLNSGSGTGVVVDAGPDPVLADRCLRALGITRIPLLILTHFHADHVAGLPGVLRGRAVGAIETTTLDSPAPEAASVVRAAAAAHVPLVRAAAGERRRLGALEWQVLWPPPAPAELPDEGPNDASVALLVTVAGLTLALLGDLEPAAQQEVLARNPGLPRADVLKVAHHGSAHQDPALLARLRPRLALISCGAHNRYGHPSPRTLDALHAQGATVLRTDTAGSIAVTGRDAPVPGAGPPALSASVVKGAS
ncbi:MULTISPECIES: ComEC/Rec2 family competence protein [Streptomycetaceae]|uniref:ComEC/Rec2-related protein n=1 Tax=Streptantibioticus cattleyicolor (strain ATCC 35852 / DSM 46488 / JCM 4925 / NBRC 14057 / NRRL 8057) TaxID=1003195 RepID=F8JYS9_STREN|nr:MULTISPECIES: ComEC/Rec2 family competence protein [Streptomycetaceae]AEW93987.1 ComEC/Rec2-related protein [Streptantibioticus cattleyicolor NRRL 8057 = DSM 46488]MYS58660.1 MBL fold metallo-hydrolase [Streptomyces sp. SID5468]CCB74330.1 putative integral membrane protein [Streptantibioticus cattleyicolor NRRL 8057 = DSM 46488]